MAKVPGPIRDGGMRAMHGTLSDAERQVPGQGPRPFNDKAMSTSLPTGKRGELNAKHSLDEGIVPRLSPRQRTKQDVGLTSPAVVAAMKQEDSFLESVGERLLIYNQRFIDRRDPPGRDRRLGKVGASAERQRII